MDATQQQPMQGDDELVKALGGNGLHFEETPVADGAVVPTVPDNEASPMPAAPVEPPTIQHTSQPVLADNPPVTPGTADITPEATPLDPELEKLKTSALEELKPLVSKLNLPAEEKFDTLLLIIRSTDDHTLLDDAHTAAKDIADDTKRAQALLDIIKEIDYFSVKK